MNDQDKIQEALVLACEALPQKFDAPDVETYRICLSADVTARCRQLGLLTPTQFVCYSARYLPDASWGTPTLYVAVHDEAVPTLFREGAPHAGRPYIPVPVAEEMRKEFLAIKDPLHLLARHEVHLTVVRSSLL